MIREKIRLIAVDASENWDEDREDFFFNLSLWIIGGGAILAVIAGIIYGEIVWISRAPGVALWINFAVFILILVPIGLVKWGKRIRNT